MEETRQIVYDVVRSVADFEPWIELLRDLPEEVMDRAWKRVPQEWVAGDEDARERLLERLFERRRRVPELIAACRAGRFKG